MLLLWHPIAVESLYKNEPLNILNFISGMLLPVSIEELLLHLGELKAVWPRPYRCVNGVFYYFPVGVHDQSSEFQLM